MNNRQLKQIRMFIRMRLFFKKNTLVLTVFGPLAALIVKFLLGLTALENEVNIQDLNMTGVAKDKVKKKNVMIELIIPLARKAMVWALEIGNETVASQFDIHRSDFECSEVEYVAIVDNVYDLLTTNSLALVTYNITALQLTALDAAIEDFKDTVETPEMSLALGKAATSKAVTEIKTNMSMLTKIDDLLISEFGITNADMVLDYKINRKIGTQATQHTILTAHVYGDIAHTTPILGAIISIVELDRSVGTDNEGMGEIVQFAGGNYNLKIVAKGKVNYLQAFTVKSGKHLELDIVLTPNIIYGSVTNNGKPALNQPVSIENTNLQVMTDNFGNFEMPDVPDGHGVIKTSTPGGDSVSVPFDMVNGEDLNIDLNVV